MGGFFLFDRIVNITDENKTQDESKEVSAKAETIEVVSEKPVVEPAVETSKIEEVIVEEKPILVEPKLEEKIVVENVESEVIESPKVEEVTNEQGEQIEKPVLDNVEKMFGVSDATATRYLDELEKEQKIRQIGKTGQNVFYTLKN